MATGLAAAGILAVGSGCNTTEPLSSPPGLVLWEKVSVDQTPASADLLARGKRLYSVRCATCHGSDGNGRGPASIFLDPPPRDFTRGSFKLRSTHPDGMPADMDLFRTITAGFPAFGMPSFVYLSEEDRWSLVYYVKSLYPRWDQFAAADVIIIGDAPPVDSGTLDRGRVLYEETYQCITCHGAGGGGDGPRAHDLRGQWDLPILPRDFTTGSTFQKAGGREEDLVRILATGLQGTSMPSYLDRWPDPTNMSALWDVARYVTHLQRQAETRQD